MLFTTSTQQYGEAYCLCFSSPESLPMNTSLAEEFVICPPFRLYLIFSILFFLIAAVPDFRGFENFSPEERLELIQDLEDSGLAINNPAFTGSENFSPEESEEPIQDLEDPGIAINDFVADSNDQLNQNLQDAELVNDADNFDLKFDPQPS